MRQLVRPSAVLVLVLAALSPLYAASAPQGAAAERAFAERLAGRVQELASAGEFSGVVLVAKQGRVVAEVAAGLAERRFAVPVTTDTRFNVGSITKDFTRLAIRQLAAAGKLGLDDPLVKHLPDYPDADIARRVTLRQLLDMQSGLGDFFGERYQATPKDQLRELSDYLPLFAGRPLLFEPGSSRRYSNAGYVALGLVIERLTGRSYRDVVESAIFAPAGMPSAGFFAPDDVEPRVATGYTRAGWGTGEAPHGPWLTNVYSLPGRGSSAGGSYATARDLLAFDRALATGVFAAAGIPGGSGGQGIAGGAPGLNAALESDWDLGWTIVVLANLDPPSAEKLAREIREQLGLPADSEGPPHR